jgi:hypothetical protein
MALDQDMDVRSSPTWNWLAKALLPSLNRSRSATWLNRLCASAALRRGSDESAADCADFAGRATGTPRVVDDFLAIYLRDQLALGIGWRELARRAEQSNRGSELGGAVERVAGAIAEDVQTFEAIMRRLSVRPNPVKNVMAMAAERAGRLKLNGRVRGYSPLSRFVELEALVMGIEGKKVLWTTLADIAELRSRVPDVDFDELIARADKQRAELEPFRVRVGKEAFRS